MDNRTICRAKCQGRAEFGERQPVFRRSFCRTLHGTDCNLQALGRETVSVALRHLDANHA